MASRHVCRQVLAQSLYEWDFTCELKKKSIYSNPQMLLDINSRNEADFGNKIDIEFMQHILHGVMDRIKEIDELIKKYAPEWPLDQIARIDRSVLRLGIFELYWSSEVPPKVAIDESVELAKAFGGSNASKFINGVLGSVMKNHEKEIMTSKSEKTMDTDTKNKDEVNNSEHKTSGELSEGEEIKIVKKK